MPPKPKHHQRPEDGIALDPDDDFLAARDHLLHLHATDGRARMRIVGALDQRRERRARGRLALHVEDDAAGFRFVQNIGADELHRHRKADPRRKARGVIRAGRQRLGRRGEAVGRQQRPRLHRVKRTLPGPLGDQNRVLHLAPRLRPLQRRHLPIRRFADSPMRRFAHSPDPPPPPPQDAERLDRILREGVGRQLDRVRRSVGRLDAGFAHQTGEHRLGRLRLGLHGRVNRLDDRQRPAERLGRQDRQHAVHGRIGQHGRQRAAIVRLIRAAEHVDRAGQLGIGMQEAAQDRSRLGAGLSQAQAGRLEHIGGDRGRAAGVGEDRDPVAGRERLVGQRQRRVEQRLHPIHFDGAGLLAGGPKRRVRAGQRAGVRGGRGLAAGGAAGLEHEHRLDRGRIPQRGHERFPALDILQIEDDDAAVGVGGQDGQQVRLVDVGLVAHAQQAAEADAVADGPIDDAAAQRARLR